MAYVIALFVSKLLTKPKTQSVRSECIWIPGVSSTAMNSAEALSSLGAYQAAMVSTGNLNLKLAAVRRSRAISLYAERANNMMKVGTYEADMKETGTKPCESCTMEGR